MPTSAGVFFARIPNETSKGLITIARKKKADWNAIKAEYIAGGVSVHALADKYKISYSTVRTRYEQDGWKAAREKAKQKASDLAAMKLLLGEKYQPSSMPHSLR